MDKNGTRPMTIARISWTRN